MLLKKQNLVSYIQIFSTWVPWKHLSLQKMIPSDCFLNSPTGSTEQNSDHSRCKRKELIHYVQQVPQGFGLNSLQDLVERAVRLESLLEVWWGEKWGWISRPVPRLPYDPFSMKPVYFQILKGEFSTFKR